MLSIFVRFQNRANTSCKSYSVLNISYYPYLSLFSPALILTEFLMQTLETLTAYLLNNWSSIATGFAMFNLCANYKISLGIEEL